MNTALVAKHLKWSEETDHKGGVRWVGWLPGYRIVVLEQNRLGEWLLFPVIPVTPSAHQSLEDAKAKSQQQLNAFVAAIAEMVEK